MHPALGHPQFCIVVVVAAAAAAAAVVAAAVGVWKDCCGEFSSFRFSRLVGWLTNACSGTIRLGPTYR